jgi:prepilin-type N-terminal cleavage/methylation domain-containing protein
MRNNKGFSLIELAMVMVIIGLLIGLGAGMVGSLTKRTKVIGSRELVDAAVDSIISYGVSHNKLPGTGEFATVVRSPNDAWQKPLYYDVDSNLTGTSGLCGMTTGLTVKVCPDTTCNTPISTTNNVAFLVVSGNENYNIQTNNNSGTIQVYEMDVNVDDYTSDMNRVEPNDDIVKWITLGELQTQGGCEASNYQLRILNNELPYGYENADYDATIYADGGEPFSSGGKYKWCREESMSTGLTFSPSTLNADCLGLAEGSWSSQADALVISGAPTAPGSFNLTFYVRDNYDASSSNDNIAQKSFVLTINALEPEPCVGYRVWNSNGYEQDFKVDGYCNGINAGSEITSTGSNRLLNLGEIIGRYASGGGWGGWGGSCQSDDLREQMSYNEARNADNDRDCCVYFNETDRSCP